MCSSEIFPLSAPTLWAKPGNEIRLGRLDTI
jgi:hypothetical protein